ncbi:hypothetical protein [Pseudarthrobacter sp. H2]|uniref:hypothetical protein n=1 Tax=Pseudarthrobacter sp. H2 TaxID=3418415 RepID=UPI003CFB9FB4
MNLALLDHTVPLPPGSLPSNVLPNVYLCFGLSQSNTYSNFAGSVLALIDEHCRDSLEQMFENPVRLAYV